MQGSSGEAPHELRWHVGRGANLKPLNNTQKPWEKCAVHTICKKKPWPNDWSPHVTHSKLSTFYFADFATPDYCKREETCNCLLAPLSKPTTEEAKAVLWSTVEIPGLIIFSTSRQTDQLLFGRMAIMLKSVLPFIKKSAPKSPIQIRRRPSHRKILEPCSKNNLLQAYNCHNGHESEEWQRPTVCPTKKQVGTWKISTARTLPGHQLGRRLLRSLWTCAGWFSTANSLFQFVSEKQKQSYAGWPLGEWQPPDCASAPGLDSQKKNGSVLTVEKP